MSLQFAGRALASVAAAIVAALAAVAAIWLAAIFGAMLGFEPVLFDVGS